MGNYNETERQRQERIELLKLKQGLIEESELIPEKHFEIEKPKGFKKVTNFIYHYKIAIIVAAFFLLAGGYAAYSMLSREKADFRLLVIANEDYSLMSEKIEKAIELYTPDYDQNGYVHVDVRCLCTGGEENSQQYSINRMQIAGEIATADSMMILADSTAPELFEGDNYTAIEDITSRYSGDARVNKSGYQISGTEFARQAGLDTEDIITDLFFMVRKTDYSVAGKKETMTENQQKAFAILDNIVTDNQPNK